MKKADSFWMGMMLTLLLVGALASAQVDEIVISLTVPQFLEDLFDDEILAEFEAENPGIRVHIVNPPGFAIPFDGEEPIDEYLNAVEDYVRSADVVLIDSDTLLPEATRAGYFLDLYPLVNTDPAVNSDDFYLPVWQSFQWDGGMWAFPVTVDAFMIFYDQAAFDAANLAYPAENWTMYDYEYAVRQLTRFNADGSTATPGWINSGGDFGTLFLAAINDTVYDNAVIPGVPRYDNPLLEEVLEILAQMYRDGLMDIPNDDDFDFEDVPLQLGRVAFNVGGFSFGNRSPKTPALLPGGRAGLVVDAYAISSGSLHPEAAYQLVRFLSYSPEAANGFFGGRPARRSLQETAQLPGGAFAQRFLSQTSPETEALVERGFEDGIPTGETRFAGYLEDAVSKMVFQGLDARAALDETELEVLDRLETADARRETVQIVVQPPPLPSVLAPGEIRIYFGIISVFNPAPNFPRWAELAQAFVSNDPDVGDIVLDTAFPNDLNQLTEEYDCFYMDTNVVKGADLSLLRSIDPLLSSDPAFDPNDIVGNALQQVRRNDQTWALPLMIQPAAMRYNPALFAQAGAYPPADGWTVDQFEDALRLLLAYLPEGEAPYEPHEFGSSYLLLLIASYGGLPFDYRTDPPTVNFTDPATIEAVRSVLDLAKNGYIAYRDVANVGGFAFEFRDDEEVPLYSEVLNVFSMGGFFAEETGDEYRNVLIPFPTGSQYTAVSYDVGAAYIGARSQHAEACYRFISYIALSPDLFTGMPARRSLINSHEVRLVQGDEIVAFYNTLDDLMSRPNTINIPALQLSMDGVTRVIETFWLGRTFDRYVNADANLESELEEAEIFTQAYLGCVENIPPFDPAVEEPQTYFTQFAQCAFRIDPTVIGFFSQ